MNRRQQQQQQQQLNNELIRYRCVVKINEIEKNKIRRKPNAINFVLACYV